MNLPGWDIFQNMKLKHFTYNARADPANIMEL